MTCFRINVLTLDGHQLVFNLYLNLMKRASLFYLFLVHFKVCRSKRDIRIVIRENSREDSFLSVIHCCFEV